MILFSRFREKLNNRNTGGFTLVELIVVLVIIGIISAVSAGGLIGYTHNAAYRRNNEKAESIFNAAQSALSYYKASGKLSSFKKSLPSTEAVPASVLPSDVSSERVVELMLTKNEGSNVSAYAAGSASLSDEAKALVEMLRDYVTEADIYNAAICVEFDPTDGIVYSVCYCDRAEDFTYSAGSEGNTLSIDAASREKSSRRKTTLGYYSSEMLSAEPGKNTNVQLDEVKLTNADTLDLSWKLSETSYEDLKKLEYTIILKAKTDTESDYPNGRVKITLTPDTLTNGETSGALLSAKVELYAAENETPKTIDSLNFHGYYDAEKGIVLTLDAIDKGLVDAVTYADIQNTFSIRRLSQWSTGTLYGLDLDDSSQIIANVSVGNSSRDSNYANTLFAEPVYTGSGDDKKAEDVKTGDGTSAVYTYGIENMRHLYNAGFREKDRNYKAQQITYEVRKNIAWGGIGENNTLKADAGESTGSSLETTYGLLSYTTGSPDGGAQSLGAGESYTKFFNKQQSISNSGSEAISVYPAFPGIETLGSSSESDHTSILTSKEQEKYALKDGEDSFVISNLALGTDTSDSSDAQKSIGLVGTNYGTISSLVLKDADVRGVSSDGSKKAANVGAFCGLNGGTLSNLTTVEGSVTGGTNVGGIVGANLSGSNAALDQLVNGADVSGIKKVGGIIGTLETVKANGEADASAKATVTLSGAENTGAVYGYTSLDGSSSASEEDSPEYIGGIVGYVPNYASVSGCKSTPKLPSDEPGSAEETYEALIEKYGNADYVGGIAGYTEDSEEAGIRISDCTVFGGYIIGRDYVGGIVGYTGKNSNVQKSVIGDESQKSFIYGRDYTGGTVGYNNCSLSADTTIEGEAAVQGRHFVGGFAGVTTSGLEARKVSLESVAGEFYVGGYVGGAFLAEGETNLIPDVSTYLPCRDVTGSAFVGGVLGYESNTELKEDSLNSLIENAETLQELLDNAGEGLLSLSDAQSAALQSILNFAADGDASEITIGPSETAEVSTDAKITGNLFVGGLFGYITPNSSWVVQNTDLTGITVTAGNAVAAFGNLTKYNGDEGTKTYSFAGGITGYITERSRVSNCSVSGSIISKGSCIGALAEISEGTIENCTVKDFTASNDYIGGLVGLNGYKADDSNAVIQNCIGSGSIVLDGQSAVAVGGFAGENFGSITGITSEVSVTASGSCAGGIAGKNMSHGMIVNAKMNGGTVTGSDHVGGMCGSNAGTVQGCEFAGGIVEGKIASGGIAGENSASGTITACAVSGGTVKMHADAVPSAQQSEGMPVYTAAGLFAGYNAGTLEFNSQEIGSPALIAARADYVGSIAGINSGSLGNTGSTIEFSYNISDEAGNGSVGIAMGGVVGQNTGSISRINFCGNLTGNGSGKYYGGIAGENSGNGVISDSWPGKQISSDTTIISTQAPVTLQAGFTNAIGGVTGYNTDQAALSTDTSNGSGYAYGRNVSSQSVVLKLTSESGTDALKSALGGMIGINSSSVSIGGITNSAAYSFEAVAGSGPVGGVIGIQKSGTTLSTLKNIAAVSSSGDLTGGVIGSVETDDTSALAIQSCSNEGQVNGTAQSAGIANIRKAQDGQNITILSSANAAGVYGTENSAGIANMLESGNRITLYISDCTNTANITGENYASGILNAGGTGEGSAVTVESCTNGTSNTASARVSDTAWAAGIANFADVDNGAAVAVNNCKNYSATKNSTYSAGIANFSEINAGSGTVAVNGCFTYWNDAGKSGAITGSGRGTYASGIANLKAVNSGTVTIEGCQNRNAVSNSNGILTGIANVINGTQTSSGSVSVTDCANAGPFGQNGVGVATRSNVNQGNLPYLLIDKCRNYGGCQVGIYAGYNSNASLITNNSESATAVWIQYCISMEGGTAQIASNSNLGEDYLNFRTSGKSSSGLGTGVTWRNGRYRDWSWQNYLPERCQWGISTLPNNINGFANQTCDAVDGYDTGLLYSGLSNDFRTNGGMRGICFNWPIKSDGNYVNTASLAEEEIETASLEEDIVEPETSEEIVDTEETAEPDPSDGETEENTEEEPVELTAPQITNGTATVAYDMSETDETGLGDSYETSQTNLLHPMISWSWDNSMPEAEESDTGYHISVYALVDNQTDANSDTYKNPTTTVDLIKNSDGSGYHIERSLTQVEINNWLNEHPGEALPEYIYQSISIDQNGELFAQAYAADNTVTAVYEIGLNSFVMGSDVYSYTFSQSVEGVGMRTISEVCPIIRIYEYNNGYTAVQLILPDVEAQEEFLYDYTRLVKTQSITIEALRQSRFEMQEENVTAQRAQWIRLINQNTWDSNGSEALVNLTRTLAPSDLFDLVFDPSTVTLENASAYIILPRNYYAQIVTQSGSAQTLADQAAAEESTADTETSEAGPASTAAAENLIEIETSEEFSDNTVSAETAEGENEESTAETEASAEGNSDFVSESSDISAEAEFAAESEVPAESSETEVSGGFGDE